MAGAQSRGCGIGALCDKAPRAQCSFESSQKINDAIWPTTGDHNRQVVILRRNNATIKTRRVSVKFIFPIFSHYGRNGPMIGKSRIIWLQAGLVMALISAVALMGTSASGMAHGRSADAASHPSFDTVLIKMDDLAMSVSSTAKKADLTRCGTYCACNMLKMLEITHATACENPVSDLRAYEFRPFRGSPPTPPPRA